MWMALLLAVGATLATASDWAAAFPKDTVATHVETGVKAYVVVGAGSSAPDLSAATTAVVDALRAAPGVQLVMTSEALGDVAALSDAELVARVATLPVDRAVVVRVYPASAGSTAVATVYDKQGAVAGALSADPTHPLVAKATGSAAAVAVAAVSAGAATDREAALQAFKERYVGFLNVTTVSASSGAILRRSATPYKGAYEEPLPGGKFYTYIGRDDLTKTYRTRQAVRTSVSTGGLAAATVGLVLFLDDPLKNATASYALLGSGGGLMLISGLIKPHPAKAEEQRRMADEFNQALATELGLDASDMQGLGEGHEAVPAVPFAQPILGPGGVGVAGGVRF